MHSWFYALLFFLPAGVANMAPLIANKIPGLNQWKTPLDLGTRINGQPIFGPNKTVRGVVSGTVAALITGLVLFQLYSFPYEFGIFVIGTTLMGLGALLGDAIESFFKRKAGIKPGNSWFPFDQLDYIIGGLVLSYFVLLPPFELVLRVAVLYFGLHLLISYVGYLLGFKQQPI